MKPIAAISIIFPIIFSTFCSTTPILTYNPSKPVGYPIKFRITSQERLPNFFCVSEYADPKLKACVPVYSFAAPQIDKDKTFPTWMRTDSAMRLDRLVYTNKETFNEVYT